MSATTNDDSTNPEGDKDASECTERKDREETRKYIMEDWKLKADQRLRTFNFFIVVYGVVAAGLLNFIKDSQTPWIGVIGGLWLAFVSYVFWRIDCRSGTMLKNSEKIFQALELELAEKFRVFSQDKAACDLMKKDRWCITPYTFPFTFGESFRLLFIAFGLGGIGLLIAALCIYKAPVEPPTQSSIPVQQIFNIGTPEKK